MRRSTRLFRLSALLAATSLATGPVFAQAPGPAITPPGGAPAPASQQGGSPPEMVGRLSQITGTVSFHGPEDSQWSPATLNYPVSTGDAFWTEPQAAAEIEFAGNRVDMQSSTEFDVNELNEQALIATEPQGLVCIALAGLPNGNSVTVQTPRGSVQIATNGRYAIGAGDTQAPTTVTVLDGAAQVTGTGVSLQVAPHQTATITGDTQFQGNVGAMQRDPCPTPAAPPQQQQASAAPAGVPPSVQYMTGYEDLNQYGSWSSTPEYGQVWYPQVGADWVPYREGRWAYVGPWGWTWVDNEPWGFAPFHYGRWAYVGNRWGWVPAYPGAPVVRPVYAPALVTFFGIGVGGRRHRRRIGARVGRLGAARSAAALLPVVSSQPDVYPQRQHHPRHQRERGGEQLPVQADSAGRPDRPAAQRAGRDRGAGGCDGALASGRPGGAARRARDLRPRPDLRRPRPGATGGRHGRRRQCRGAAARAAGGARRRAASERAWAGDPPDRPRRASAAASGQCAGRRRGRAGSGPSSGPLQPRGRCRRRTRPARPRRTARRSSRTPGPACPSCGHRAPVRAPPARRSRRIPAPHRRHGPVSRRPNVPTRRPTSGPP